MSERVNDINYVHDALRERLPAGWSLNRWEAQGQPHYRWTKWSTGEQLVCLVHEGYASAVGEVDALCDKLMTDVLEVFNDPWARDTSPISKRRLVNGRA